MGRGRQMSSVPASRWTSRCRRLVRIGKRRAVMVNGRRSFSRAGVAKMEERAAPMDRLRGRSMGGLQRKGGGRGQQRWSTRCDNHSPPNCPEVITITIRIPMISNRIWALPTPSNRMWIGDGTASAQLRRDIASPRRASRTHKVYYGKFSMRHRITSQPEADAVRWWRINRCFHKPPAWPMSAGCRRPGDGIGRRRLRPPTREPVPDRGPPPDRFA